MIGQWAFCAGQNIHSVVVVVPLHVSKSSRVLKKLITYLQSRPALGQSFRSDSKRPGCGHTQGAIHPLRRILFRILHHLNFKCSFDIVCQMKYSGVSRIHALTVTVADNPDSSLSQLWHLADLNGP
jgi:hypothetical protein